MSEKTTCTVCGLEFATAEALSKHIEAAELRGAEPVSVREALKKWGSHLRYCAQNRWPPKGGGFAKCDCGFDAALSSPDDTAALGVRALDLLRQIAPLMRWEHDQGDGHFSTEQVEEAENLIRGIPKSPDDTAERLAEADSAYCYVAWLAGRIPWPSLSEDDAVKWGIDAIERHSARQSKAAPPKEGT